MEGEQEKLLGLQIFPVTEDLTPPRRGMALRRSSIAASNDQGRQIWPAQWVKGIPMETSVHWDLEANLEEGFSQTPVTTPKASLADQTVGPKVPENPSALPADRSVDHLPGVAAFPAQTVMAEAVHSGTVAVEVGREASPVVASLVAIRLEASLVDMVAVAAVDNYWAGMAVEKTKPN